MLRIVLGQEQCGPFQALFRHLRGWLELVLGDDGPTACLDKLVVGESLLELGGYWGRRTECSVVVKILVGLFMSLIFLIIDFVCPSLLERF